jgi:hypothetical protein
MAHTFQLTSPAFADGDTIPERFACEGDNVSPALAIAGVPQGSQSLSLIMHDPDALRGDFVHWLVGNIPVSNKHLLEGKTPDSAIQGTNDFGHDHYDGPCPPSGVHHYVFDLYALDAMLDLEDGAPEEDFRTAFAEHAIAKTTLMGRFGAKALA